AWSVVERIIGQFTGADKFLVSVPMWNFSVPYRLKQYLDIIMQPGYTFGADENGYFGLVKDKPIAIIYARGGEYRPGSDREAFDMQKKYLELAFGMMGFAGINSIVVEPTLQGGPETTEKIMQAAIEQAQKLARNF
ncbi:MAG: NAD(P)H-dependent oxidoreductase, partial [Anaerohalosphaera sp.]|nr:NAD(P)H-dependent oxidoreductase [Anaerohalosphaera sp.]